MYEDEIRETREFELDTHISAVSYKWKQFHVNANAYLYA